MIVPRCTLALGKLQLNLYPDPFNKKEHALITITTNTGFAIANAYATIPITVMRKFYGVNFNARFDILLILTTQLLGFSFAGIMRQVLV
jgi:OPT oligopeptide transporter protein